MRDSYAVQARRIAAGIMMLMMLVAVPFSAFYIVAEADHDCTGEDCPICACMRQCENMLHRTGLGTVQQDVFVVPFILAPLAVVLDVCAISRDTLVSKKVRLNN